MLHFRWSIGRSTNCNKLYFPTGRSGSVISDNRTPSGARREVARDAFYPGPRICGGVLARGGFPQRTQLVPGALSGCRGLRGSGRGMADRWCFDLGQGAHDRSRSLIAPGDIRIWRGVPIKVGSIVGNVFGATMTVIPRKRGPRVTRRSPVAPGPRLRGDESYLISSRSDSLVVRKGLPSRRCRTYLLTSSRAPAANAPPGPLPTVLTPAPGVPIATLWPAALSTTSLTHSDPLSLK